MADKNDVVIIELDRPRVLRYGHSALKRLSAMTGMSMDDMGDIEDFDLEKIETFIYCGLLTDARENNETLKPEDMEELLDQAPSYGHVIERMQQAFSAAFGNMGDMEGNLPAPAPKPNRQQRRAGAGKKA